MDIKIGQDSGAGCNKIAYFDENLNIVEKLIPSLAKLGKATVSMTQNTGITYFCEGEEWSFNPDLTNTEDTRIGSYPYSILNTVLSVHALKEAGFSSSDSLLVGSGIPLNHYFAGASINKANVDRKFKVFDREVSILGGGDVPTPVMESVFPEALSGWVDICIGADGEETEDTDRPVGLVDIGGRTTDIAVALPGFQIDPDFTDTFDIGCLDICEKLNEYLSKEYDCGKIETVVLDHSLRSKKIKIFRNEEIDISDHVQNAINYVCNDIMRKAEKKLGGASLAGTCYFGGGVEYMRDNLAEGKNIFIPENPQFSNARGYLKAMTYLQG